MSLDPATEYLIRKDKKALEKRLKKNERTISIVQAKWHDQVGLLAATNKRLVFIFKAGLRFRTLDIPRTDWKNFSEMRGRPSSIHLNTKSGKKQRFVMLQHGAAEVFIEKVQPSTKIDTGRSKQARKDGPMVFKPSKPIQPPQPAQPTQQGSRPTRGRGDAALSASNAQKLARLESQFKAGRISEGEYRWQLDALKR